MMDSMEKHNENVVAARLAGDVDAFPMDDLNQTGAGIVKPRWRGTVQDVTDMEILGRHQVLRVWLLSRD